MIGGVFRTARGPVALLNGKQITSEVLSGERLIFWRIFNVYEVGYESLKSNVTGICKTVM